MKKSLNPKSFPAWMARGEEPNHSAKGITAEIKALRNKYRSPFGFCGPKRTKSA